MATISKNWQSQSWVLGGSASWSTLSGTTETLSSSVDLVTSGYMGADVLVEVNFDATPTDHVTVSFYGSLDGSNFDDLPFYSFTMDNANDAQVSVVIRDKAYFKVGFVQTGSTDSHDVRASHCLWNYTSA